MCSLLLGLKKGSGGTETYAWGAGYNGQLGGKLARGQRKYSATPLFVEIGEKVRQVDCGGLHSAVVTGLANIDLNNSDVFR